MDRRYVVSSLIGQGSFGCVYKAKRRADDKVVAIKVIPKRGRSNRELKNLRRECDIQAQLKHPNVIEMIESFDTKNDLYVVTEFALTDLHRYLSINGAMTEEHAQRVICHLVSALYYLHSNRILHRDLKPQNVLLDNKMHAKLCDFGLARNMTMGTHVLTSIKGTPLYMAPELLAEQPYDHHADMWSLGCIAYESVAGQPPFCTTSILHLVKLIKHEEVKWPSTLSSDCRSFLQGLLEKDPSMRISWSQLLCHPFVEDKLYIAPVNDAKNSPFINPQAAHPAKSKPKKQNDSLPKVLPQMLDALQLNDIVHGDRTLRDNLTSSRDSINAIAPSDVEHLETDVEDNVNRVIVPFATDISFKRNNNNEAAKIYHNEVAAPVINSQTCFVSGNANMILNHLNDNFPTAEYNNTTKELQPPMQQQSQQQGQQQQCQNIDVSINNSKSNIITKKSRSKDLEKRKLSQNLDNFSLRLGQSIDMEVQRKTTEMLTLKRDKEQKLLLKNSTQSTDEKQSTDNTPPCLLPGWDSCDESQSPPIENDEWLAFLNRSIQEIFDGEFDSLKQHNLVSIIVAPLRNSKAIPKVLNSVAQLLSLPFVLAEPSIVADVIKNVYSDVKLVPNLMYACKLMVSHRLPLTDSAASMTASAPLPTRTVRTIAELNNEEINTACSLYELVCHLVHLKQQFLTQFCDAVAILAVDDLYINFLSHDFKNASAVRIANCILALLCCVLRELPENAELVEKIVFNPKLDLVILLENKNDLLRLRACMLIRLLTRFSLRGLQNIWRVEIKKAIEQLIEEESHNDVREEATHTLDELAQFSFFA